MNTGGKQVKRKKSIILPSVIPVRFPAGEELAAAMRALPVKRLARALAGWVGDEPIPIADGWQAPETKLDAARALGLVAEDGTLTDEITRRLNWIYESPSMRGTSTRNTEPSTATRVWTQRRNKPTPRSARHGTARSTPCSRTASRTCFRRPPIPRHWTSMASATSRCSRCWSSTEPPRLPNFPTRSP